ncbi:GT-D fold domain-containing glycosyltransferase [Paenibacillus sp. LHD-38]|uniref:GT-D fold domain-containing glycosyltransferase n=1 Tax=Paenibacillus sp. LHD-38 TaxID=3072143 RepID=UPI00280EB5C7|nr:GT-D fold domain-containing glycosyltransferase [Paenibacillus sp. LHD-38]MDQ8735764.1 GT-D fold domain-containing glycosyltransferase [Paenibacillus sp. LHD-38]
MNLNWEKVLHMIKHALDHRQPFSIVRIGDGENIVMAQRSVWRMSSVLKEPWAIRANRGQKGVRLPNLTLRDQMIRSIKMADIVGVLPPGDRRTYAPRRLKRPLTNKIFQYYKLKPRYTCDAVVNRFLAGRKEFWDVLRGRRVLIITRHAERLKRSLQRDPYRMNVVGTIAFSNNKQMGSALKKAYAMKDKFDIALISCGVNTVVLAPEIARLTGKVAMDFGKGHHVVFRKKTIKGSTKFSDQKINNAAENNLMMLTSQYIPGKVSVVVLNHNSLKSTKECIESIQQHSPINTQLVLVDNGSTDGTAEYIQTIPGSTVIKNEVTKERCEAMNQGVIAASGEYIVLLNENTVVKKNWLHGMLWWLRADPTIGIVGVRKNAADGSHKVEIIPYETMQEMDDFSAYLSEIYNRQGHHADALRDLCIMFHHDLALQIGSFEERYDLLHG